MTTRRDKTRREKCDERLIRVGELLRRKREGLSNNVGKNRQRFIEWISINYFGGEDWISERHLINIENGKNLISIELLFKFATALEVEPKELFAEIVEAWKGE